MNWVGFHLVDHSGNLFPVNRVELVPTNPSALLASKKHLAELFDEGGEMLQVRVFDV